MKNNEEKSENEKENEQCTHIKELIDPETIKEISKNIKCSICEEKPENIILCLNCGKYFCETNHIKQHLEEKDHNITINMKTLTVNCSKCDKLTQNQIKYHFEYIYEIEKNSPYFELFSVEEIKEIKYNKFIKLLKENKFKKVIFMVGAGISTSAGIPDFRSESGLFKQLQSKYNLSRPEEFFDISLFLKNPNLFYEFTKLFDLSKIKATLTHKFIAYMLHKNYAKYLFTQNIDGLEKKAKIPDEKVIYAHGTFGQAHCPKCKKNVDINLMNEYIQKEKILTCSKCNVPCKPNVVFYGENLPVIFFEKLKEIQDTDLVIIMGTSLIVQPFASIPYYTSDSCWKVAVNRELIGNFQYNFLTSNSVFLEGNTDHFSMKIIKDCGWEKDYLQFAKENYDDDDIIDLEKKIEMLSIDENKKEEEKENKKEENKKEEEKENKKEEEKKNKKEEEKENKK